MEYIVTPYLPVPKTLKEMQTYCDYLNAIGKKCREAGIKYGYHNHAHEFQKIEDKAVMLDYMIENTDPENLFIELDVYWAVMGKASPVDYFHKYPGRFKMLHINCLLYTSCLQWKRKRETPVACYHIWKSIKKCFRQ